MWKNVEVGGNLREMVEGFVGNNVACGRWNRVKRKRRRKEEERNVRFCNFER